MVLSQHKRQHMTRTCCRVFLRHCELQAKPHWLCFSSTDCQVTCVVQHSDCCQTRAVMPDVQSSSLAVLQLTLQHVIGCECAVQSSMGCFPVATAAPIVLAYVDCRYGGVLWNLTSFLEEVPHRTRPAQRCRTCRCHPDYITPAD